MPAKIDYLLKLQQLIQQLRHPQQGCPWLREQTLASIAMLTVEESYELADSIDNHDTAAIADELSDLLFHLLLYAEIGKEQQLFDLDEIAKRAIDKQLRRKPVFADQSQATASEALALWEQNKKKEYQQHGKSSALDGITRTVPSLNYALKLQQKAAYAGFDWPNPEPVFAKLDEEIAELKVEVNAANAVTIQEELGDLLFTCVNLARHLQVDPEAALRYANAKFERRFKAMEDEVKAKGHSLAELELAELDKIWDAVKKCGRLNPSSSAPS